jgi:hypothetical protein
VVIRSGIRARGDSALVALAEGRHPRHPPSGISARATRAYVLGALLFLALPPCGAVLGQRARLGGGRNPPPSFGLLLAVVVRCLQYREATVVRLKSAVRLHVPSESALAQPPSSFSSPMQWLRFLRAGTFVRVGAHPSARAPVASYPMVDAGRWLYQKNMECLAHLPVRAQ